MLENNWLVIAACAGLLMAGSQSCVVSESACDDGFRAELERSGFLHEPLAVSDDLSYETLTVRTKTVEASMPVEGSWVLSLANDTGVSAKGSPNDPDYATYGSFSIDIPVNAHR